MITGRGMIATALLPANGVHLYAAGVSNSFCTDESEFKRDRDRLEMALDRTERLVYFSSCAVEGKLNRYLEHKLAMEEMVRDRGNYLICRLPVVAGKTPNPHTLLNYLYARIARGEAVEVWKQARRNVIGVIDVAATVRWLVRDEAAHGETVNIARPYDLPITEIVNSFERVLQRDAVVHLVDKGDSYPIDVRRIRGAPVSYSASYMEDLIWKYYA